MNSEPNLEKKPADESDKKAAQKSIDIPVAPKLARERKIPFFNWQKSKTLLEFIAAVGFFLMVVIGLFFWRVSTSPLDMAFAKPYIENTLSSAERHIDVKLDSIVLHWPELAGPLLLDVRGAKVYGADNNLIVDVDEVGLSLSKTGLLIGNLRPIGLIVKNPELTVIRAEDGTFDIGFGDMVKMDQLEDQTALTERILSYISKPGTEGGSSLGALKTFEIVNAQVNLEDKVTGTSSFLPELNIVFRSTNEGLDSDMFISFDDTPEWPSHLRASMLIPWDKKDVILDAQLENFDLSFLSDKIPALSILDGQDVEVDGRLVALLDQNFMPTHAQLRASSGSGAFNVPEMSDQEVPYEDFNFELAYSKTTGKLDLLNTTITVKGVTIRADGSMMATDKQISGPLKFSINELKQSQIKPLWPKALEGDNAEEWLVEKMADGTFHDVWAVIDLAALKGEEGWDFFAKDVQAAFTFEGMTVDYRNPLLPVKNGKGSGTFKLAEENLTVKVESGMIGDIKVLSGNLEFVNIIEHGKGKADIQVKLEGPLKTGLEYLSLEPITLEHDFDLAKVKGNTTASINIRFPAVGDLKVEDVKVNGTGVMSDVTLPGIMKALTLTGGPLNFSVKGNEFNLEGEGAIDGQPSKIKYSEFLNSDGQAYKSKVEAALTVTEMMRAKMGINLTEFMKGDAYASAIYTEFTDGKAVADLNIDLKPALVFFKPFGYEKQPGVDSKTTLKANLVKGELVSITELNATGPNMELKNAQFTFAKKNNEVELTGGEIPSMVVGETVGNLNFKMDAAGKYTIALAASFLDLRPFLDNDTPDDAYDDPAMNITVKADRMRASEYEPVQHATILLDIDNKGSFNNFEVTGVAGKNFNINYTPDETGARNFMMHADDAGATLRAFGVYENIVGGVLDIRGEPVKGVNDRNVSGLGQITNFKVVRAPTLARLLGILSLPGVLGVLNNDGLTFSKLEAKFDWLYRPKGSILKVKDGRTSGNAVGFTFDGTYDKVQSKIDVEGTVIPLSGVNKVIGSIPLVGDILTGGTGAVLAATYSIKGDAKKPDVFVNPLSVLTPGILRRILFEN